MVEVSALKNVRIWFTKDNECKYISHLDLNRVVMRALHKSKINLWHTEGFNPHPFVTFALPLSLGFRGVKESMDIRLINDEYNKDEIIDALNNCLPKGIHVYDVTEPVMKAGKIDKGLFEIIVEDNTVDVDTLYKNFNDLLNDDQILVMKKTKKKGFKEIDIKPHILKSKVADYNGYIKCKVLLPAGSTTNINPTLLINAYNEKYKTDVFYQITRLDIFDKDGNSFK